MSEQSPWSKPEEPLAKVEDKGWSGCSSDYFGHSLNPHIGNNWYPANIEANRQFYDNYHNTGIHGWNDVEIAIEALKRIRKDDSNGLYDTRDTYRKLCQVVRHNFRILKIEISYNRQDTPITGL